MPLPMSKKDRGSKYMLRRLKEIDPAIAQQVAAGKLTLHRAVIEAGIVADYIRINRTSPKQAAETIRKRCGEKFLDDLVATQSGEARTASTRPLRRISSYAEAAGKDFEKMNAMMKERLAQLPARYHDLYLDDLYSHWNRLIFE